MVFSFFKKQPQKMPERPAARPRSAEPEPSAPEAGAEVGTLSDPLPDLQFTRTDWKGGVAKDAPAGGTAETEKPAGGLAATKLPDFAIDEFDEDDFTESSVMAIDVDHDVDPLQSCVEQVVVLFANGQDAAARSLLETFVRSYPGPDGRRFWLLLFDLLQVSGDRAAFDKLCVDYAQAYETSPPAWSQGDVVAKNGPAVAGPHKIYLQGVLTSESAQPVAELAKLVEQGAAVAVDCGKVINCDDEVADRLARLFGHARRRALPVTLNGADGLMQRLNERLVVGDAVHEPNWRLLLELLQRFGDQALFEERAVDYAVTFELSPPSWETVPAVKAAPASTQAPPDDAFYLSGELRNHRFDELVPVLDESAQPIIDFAAVRRLDFFSAGQLVNRIAPVKARGKDVLIRRPNHLIAELMAVVGLNKLARIVVPKS